MCPSDKGIYSSDYPSNGSPVWEQTKGLSSGTSYVYHPILGQEWHGWPDQYGYEFSDSPVAAYILQHKSKYVTIDREDGLAGELALVNHDKATLERMDSGLWDEHTPRLIEDETTIRFAGAAQPDRF